MPDQPDDPIHYDMKIPPEPQDAPLNKMKEEDGKEEQRSSDEVAEESNHKDESDSSSGANPSQSPRKTK